jgi:hypothetical protein
MFKTHRNFELTNGVKSKSIAVFKNHKKTAVLYHETIVVEETCNSKNTTLKLDNGGWDTVSTRYVINTALRQMPLFNKAHLYRKKGKTYFSFGSEKSETEFCPPMTIKLNNQT